MRVDSLNMQICWCVNVRQPLFIEVFFLIKGVFPWPKQNAPQAEEGETPTLTFNLRHARSKDGYWGSLTEQPSEINRLEKMGNMVSFPCSLFPLSYLATTPLPPSQRALGWASPQFGTTHKL